MRNALTDFRYAARQLRRRWGFTAIAVLTLALGIGGASAVLAIEHALTPDLNQFADVDGVFSPIYRNPQAPNPLPLPAIRTVEQLRAFEITPPPPIRTAVAVTYGGLIFRAPGSTEIIRAEVITGGYASMFHVSSRLGRFIAPDDDRPGAPLTAVVSDRLWREVFGGDRAIINGSPVRIAVPASTRLVSTKPWQIAVDPPVYHSFTVIGVAAAGYHGLRPTDVTMRCDLWISRQAWETLNAGRARGVGTSLVRMTPGAGVPALSRTLNETLSGPLKGVQVEAVPAAEVLRASSQTATFVGLLALALFILLAACAIFGALAALVARPVAVGGVRLFGLAVPTFGRGRAAARVWSGDVVAFSPVGYILLLTAGIAALAAVAVGVLAAWRATRSPTNRTFASAGTPVGITAGTRRTSLGFVAIQVTAALLLVMAAGLYAESYRESLDRRLEFDTSGLAAAEINLEPLGFTEDRGRAFYRSLAGERATLPGLERVALADQVPGSGWLPGITYLVAEDEIDRPRVPGAMSPRISGRYSIVSPGFFDTLGLRILRGRPLWPSDQLGAERVTVVTEHVARTLWPGQDPIGKRLVGASFGRTAPVRIERERAGPVPFVVVGVAADPASSTGASALVHPASYAFIPADQHYKPTMWVLARSGNGAHAVRALQRGVQAIDDEVALQRTGTLDDAILAWVGPLRAAAFLMGSLGLIGLVISALGVYGVLAHAVSRRRREFGVRLALGATPRRLFVMVTDQALTMLLVGMLPGVLIASLGSNTVSHWLPGVQPNSITMWIAAPLAILAIGLAAALVPARRAARVDPNVALREL